MLDAGLAVAAIFVHILLQIADTYQDAALAHCGTLCVDTLARLKSLGAPRLNRCDSLAEPLSIVQTTLLDVQGVGISE